MQNGPSVCVHGSNAFVQFEQYFLWCSLVVFSCSEHGHLGSDITKTTAETFLLPGGFVVVVVVGFFGIQVSVSLVTAAISSVNGSVVDESALSVGTTKETEK